jgi:hypothetical protein
VDASARSISLLGRHSQIALAKRPQDRPIP